MRIPTHTVAATLVLSSLILPAYAAQFDQYGDVSADVGQSNAATNVVVILGAGLGAAPVYEGASAYGLTFRPIIDIERLRLPGLIDIGGGENGGGLSFAPSFSVVGERISANHSALAGLNNVAATYALGARIGYEFPLNDMLSAEIYGVPRYAFGGAEGLIGEAGLDVTARLTPQFEITGGPVVNFASENYMDKYFGVTAAESAATGGRLKAFDPTGGIKSVGIKMAARYEFVPDTFVTLNASYARFTGSPLDSPIVQSGSADQFTVGLGFSRRFSFQ